MINSYKLNIESHFLWSKVGRIRPLATFFLWASSSKCSHGDRAQIAYY